MAEKKIDEATGVETTGHEYDGIMELNNPMPRWWVSLFYATIVFAVIYSILFPAIPLRETNTKGLLGYTARDEVFRKIDEHTAMQSVWRDRISEASLQEIQNDPDLFSFALASGAASFAVNCSQCHGAGAAGNVGGFPNLNDDDWLWGGDLDNIYATIAHGVRNEDDPDARYNMMSAFGVDELLTRAEIADVTQYVLSLGSGATDAEAAGRGETLYADNCAACHGEDGKGLPELGAPNLTDDIWLYGGTAEAIQSQIWRPKHGVMPAWAPRLGETAVKELAVYVHSLGGGQ